MVHGGPTYFQAVDVPSDPFHWLGSEGYQVCEARGGIGDTWGEKINLGAVDLQGKTGS